MGEFNCTCWEKVHSSHEIKDGCPNGGRIVGLDGLSPDQLRKLDRETEDLKSELQGAPDVE